MPGRSGEPVVTTLVCFVFYCMRGCGCIKRPASPRPHFGGLRKFLAKPRAHGAARMRTHNWTSLRANGSRECAPDDRLREAIHLSSLRGEMDCFVASAP